MQLKARIGVIVSSLIIVILTLLSCIGIIASAENVVFPDYSVVFSSFDQSMYVSNRVYKQGFFTRYGIYKVDVDNTSLIPVLQTFSEINKLLAYEDVIIYEEFVSPMSVSIYSYNLQTKSKKRLLYNVYSFYALYDQHLYYTNDQVLYQLNLITNEKKKLFAFNSLQRFNNGFLYTSQRGQKVYDYYDLTQNETEKTSIPVDYSVDYVGLYGVNNRTGVVYSIYQYQQQEIADFGDPEIKYFELTDNYLYYYHPGNNSVMIHSLPSLSIAAEISIIHDHFKSCICRNKILIFSSDDTSCFDLVDIPTGESKSISIPWYSR